MMLSVAKGPCSYAAIRTVDGKQYPSFGEACFAVGLLHDDKEYIEAIKEAHHWGSGHYLRRLFVTMLISNSMNRPKHAWTQTWEYLSDDILHEQRKLSNIPGKVVIIFNGEHLN